MSSPLTHSSIPDTTSWLVPQQNLSRGEVVRTSKALIDEMARIGKDLKREDVLDCFSENVLRAFIDEQGESPSASKMFSRLQTSVDARSEIHELERSMDKKHFVELVTGGYFIAGGMDKLTQYPIFWYRSGFLSRNSWRYVFGSPRGKAFVRAQLFFMEASISQSVAHYDENKNEIKCAMYMDESERKLLDFNMRVSAQCLKLLDAVIILKLKRLVITGASEFFNMILDITKVAAPSLELCRILQLIRSDEVEAMVENVDDIPEFWFGDGEGKLYLSTDRRNVWCYERCLSDENRITQKDLYNPGQWPYEEVDYAELKRKTTVPGSSGVLETIEEHEGDDW